MPFCVHFTYFPRDKLEVEPVEYGRTGDKREATFNLGEQLGIMQNKLHSKACFKVYFEISSTHFRLSQSFSLISFRQRRCKEWPPQRGRRQLGCTRSNRRERRRSTG